jgi:hypothetical protein
VTRDRTRLARPGRPAIGPPRPARAPRPPAPQASDAEEGRPAPANFAAPWALPLVITLGLAARLAHLTAIYRSPFFRPMSTDPGLGFDEWAQDIAAGRWIGAAPFWIDPLYSYLLGAFYRVLGHGPWIPRVINLALGLAAAYLAALTARRVWSSRDAAVIAAVAGAFFVPALYYEGQTEKTALTLMLFALGVELFLRPGARAAAAAGGRDRARDAGARQPDDLRAAGRRGPGGGLGRGGPRPGSGAAPVASGGPLPRRGAAGHRARDGAQLLGVARVRAHDHQPRDQPVPRQPRRERVRVFQPAGLPRPASPLRAAPLSRGGLPADGAADDRRGAVPLLDRPDAAVGGREAGSRAASHLPQAPARAAQRRGRRPGRHRADDRVLPRAAPARCLVGDAPPHGRAGGGDGLAPPSGPGAGARLRGLPRDAAPLLHHGPAPHPGAPGPGRAGRRGCPLDRRAAPLARPPGPSCAPGPCWQRAPSSCWCGPTG